MDALLLKVVTGSPMQDLTADQVRTPQYTILSAQTPDPRTRIDVLQTRLQTSTETSSAVNMSYILNTCIATSLSPDDVEEMMERVIQVAEEHADWPEFIKWVCALVHYYCTDDFTLTLFSEFGVPQVAVRALTDFPQNQELVLAASVLLSHFNFYDIDDGITQLANVLQIHGDDLLIAKVATRALAEFTSYYKEIPDRFAMANQEFVDGGGVVALEGVLHNHIGDEETTASAARVAANTTSSGAGTSVDPDGKVVKFLAEALGRYSQSERLCSHVLRVFSNVARSQFIDWDTVGTIFSTTTSETVVLECIHFLSAVAINVKEMKPKIYSTGCVPRVLESMRTFGSSPAIQEEACSLLSYLSFDSETITASITESGGILLVLNAMRKFPDNEELLMSACAALSGLTFNNQAGQQVIVDNSGVALIIDAMRRGKKARLQENGCLAVGTMCWNSDLKADVVRLGGVRVIMRALEDHYTSSGLVKNACRALAQVAFNCERYRDDMSANGVIPLIIKGMEQHPNYDRAQMHGCVALSYLSWTNEGNAAQITANRGYKVVVDAMRNHPNNHEVQEHACRALANISNVSLEDSVAALEQIVAAMRRHERVSEVQEEACRAVVTLSLVSPTNKNCLYELGGADVVITAMKNFPRIQLVQQEACNALAHLAYEHADLNRAVTELGGVALLLTAMKTHINSPKVQLNACGGLSALAFDNTVAQQQIFELGGVQCVIHAMENFERLRMLELGCSVLGTLAWNTDIKERVAVDAIPEILKAMQVHADSPLLQKSTCRAISQFAFNSENNRQLLAEAGAIPLIINAMRTHLTTEKLIVHALKALTYLCWENTQVAETITGERVEEVLQRIVEYYARTPRIFNEAVHLSKILFRKTTSPSPNLRLISPPVASPMPIQNNMFSPGGPRRGGDSESSPPSPPPQDLDNDHLYSGPDAYGPYGPARRGRGAGRGGGGGVGGAAPPPRRGGGPAGRGGPPPPRSRQEGGRGGAFRDPNHLGLGGGDGDVGNRLGSRRQPPSGGGRHPLGSDADRAGAAFATGYGGHGGRGSAGPGRSGRAVGSEDLWDDPAPGTFCGVPQSEQHMNWQQAELVRQVDSSGSNGGTGSGSGGDGGGWGVTGNNAISDDVGSGMSSSNHGGCDHFQTTNRGGVGGVGRGAPRRFGGGGGHGGNYRGGRGGGGGGGGCRNGGVDSMHQ